jgi:adenylate cyclase
MASQQPAPKKGVPKIISNPGLRFWVIAPIFIMLILFLLALIGFSFITNQVPPVEFSLIVIASFLVVFAAALLITRKITQRFDHIINAAEQVSRGDFSIRVTDDHDDEIGQLVQAFNEMVANLEHLQESRDLLSRTMSPAVRESLIESGLDFRGLTQVVTILFIDIKGFTRITERHNPEQVVFFLNDYYTSIANQVHVGGGIVGKYGGDSILAFFGAPQPETPEKSATAGLLTALALQEAIEEMNERWTILGLPSIRVGIGISLGPVVAGPIGSEQQFEYTVIGDAVNLAARLQDLTRNVPGYNIMISREIYDALEEKIRDQLKVVGLETYNAMGPREKATSPVHFVDLGHVLVKGKKGPVHVYAIPDYEYEETDELLPEQIGLDSGTP